MSQKNKINSKRHLDQLQNIEEGGGDVSSQQSSEKVKKKQKKTTSLQGRPAKASQELRKQEEDIKKVAWRTAELEECLYLVYGGAKATHDIKQQNTAVSFIKTHLKYKVAVDDFNNMLEEWRKIRTDFTDPLGKDYVPLSDKYFLDKLFKQEVSQGENSVEILRILTIYAFQIFTRTDIVGFELILKMLSLVYKHCIKDGVVGINSSLSPENIQSKVGQDLIDEHEKEKFSIVYKLLHVVMQESFLHFSDKNNVSMRKSTNLELA